MTAPVTRYYILELPARAERAPHIRSILAAHLRYWGLEPHIGPVCRGVHELFLNAAEHAAGRTTCIVELRWNGRLLTAAVTDHAPPLPDHGGLAAVTAVSDTWGTCPTRDGKIVWFTRRATRDHHLSPGRRPATALPTATPHSVPS